MESIFPLLFGLYIILTIVSAVIKKLQGTEPTGRPRPGRRMPDTAPQSTPSRRTGPVSDDKVPGFPTPTSIPVPPPDVLAPEADDRYRPETAEDRTMPTLWPPERKVSPAEHGGTVADEPLRLDDISDEELLDTLRPAGRPGPKGPAPARLRRALTPRKVREALILSELIGPPRAFRPYSPFFWKK